VIEREKERREKVLVYSPVCFVLRPYPLRDGRPTILVLVEEDMEIMLPYAKRSSLGRGDSGATRAGMACPYLLFSTGACYWGRALPYSSVGSTPHACPQCGNYFY
jgi:hypothetical protein